MIFGKRLFPLHVILVTAAVLVVGCTSSSPTSTATSIPSTATAIVATPVLQVGFERHSFGDGRSVDLPDGWTALVVDESLLSAFNAGAELIPELIDQIGGADQLQQLVEQGARFWAIDTGNSTFDFSPNVLISEEVSSVSLENYSRLTVGQLEAAGLTVDNLEEFSVGGRTFKLIQMSIPLGDFSVTVQQFAWTEDGSIWILQFSHRAEEVDRYRSIADQSLASIQ